MSQAIQQAYDRLRTEQRSQVSVGAFDVSVARSADRSEFYLVTPVFNGGGYVPGSVRGAVGQVGLLATNQGIQALLVIDEETCEVRLRYQVTRVPRNGREFVALFEEFLAVAEEWRRLLDEHGQQDLVWVPWR